VLGVSILCVCKDHAKEHHVDRTTTGAVKGVAETPDPLPRIVSMAAPFGRHSVKTADELCGAAEATSAARRGGRGGRRGGGRGGAARRAPGRCDGRRGGVGTVAAVGEPRLLGRRQGPRPLLAGRLVERTERRRCAGRALRRAASRLRRARRAERGCEWPLRDAHMGGPRPVEARGISERDRRGGAPARWGRGGRRRAGRARWLCGGARPPAAHEPKLVDSRRSARRSRVIAAWRALRRGGRSRVRQDELG